jgi:hypothetical protein
MSERVIRPMYCQGWHCYVTAVKCDRSLDLVLKLHVEFVTLYGMTRNDYIFHFCAPLNRFYIRVTVHRDEFPYNKTN